MSLPIDFGDDDAVVEQLMATGALEHHQKQPPQNKDVVVGIGSKLRCVVKQIAHGFMQEGSNSRSSTVVTHTHVSHKLPKVEPPVVYYAPDEHGEHDFLVEF